MILYKNFTTNFHILILTNNEFLLQTVIAEVNQMIGAGGVVSQQCKAVVAQYGEKIIEMLAAKVSLISLHYRDSHVYFVMYTSSCISFTDSIWFLI